MNKHFKLLALTLFFTLTSCHTKPSSEPSFTPSEPAVSAGENTESSLPSTSEESSESSSEVLPPLSDPDVSGLARSSSWPSLALSDYLTWYDDVLMPVISAEGDFHHGIYLNEMELDFYRVLYRVRTINDYSALINLFIQYDFTYDRDPDVSAHYYWFDSIYDEISFHLDLITKNNRLEVVFDFMDGNGDSYTGLRAEGDTASFNFKNEAAVTKKSPDRVKWEVRPASFTVRRGKAQVGVGNSNYSQLKNPLIIYAGNILDFTVSSQYYIKELFVYTASNTDIEEFLEEGTFSSGFSYTRVANDKITMTFPTKISTLNYERMIGQGINKFGLVEIRVVFSPLNDR